MEFQGDMCPNSKSSGGGLVALLPNMGTLLGASKNKNKFCQKIGLLKISVQQNFT
jgi:hypothetical protein